MPDFFLTRPYELALAGMLLGGLIALLNFYLSFIRPLVIRWLGWPLHFVSGIGLVGTVCLLPAAVYFAINGMLWNLAATIILFLLDTGGAAWFLPIILRERWKK